jgi:hypothetical protein
VQTVHLVDYAKHAIGHRIFIAVLFQLILHETGCITSLCSVQHFNSYVNIIMLSNCHKHALGMEFEGLPILKLDNTLRRVIGRTRQPREMATSQQWTTIWVGHSEGSDTVI